MKDVFGSMIISTIACYKAWEDYLRTLFDFLAAAHLQRPPVLQQQLNAAAMAQSATAAATAAANASNASLLSQPNLQVSRQQEVRLQQLQLERERLKMRQQEIMRQVMPWLVHILILALNSARF